MKKKFLTVPYDLKAVEEDEDGMGIVKGYASVFNNVDLGLDIIEKGAFKKTLSESGAKVPILADHSPFKQIGFNLTAEEDDKGLFVEGRLDIKNNQLAKERFSLAKMALEIGAKFGLSIGYMTVKEEPDTKNPIIRRLIELKLFEYSFVTFPMNTEAGVTGAKSHEYAVLNDTEYSNAIANCLDMGLNKDVIIKALEKAATPINDPDDNQVQSIINNINKAKNILS